MSTESPQKVTADHLERDAFLYVRQSSLRQVFENTECPNVIAAAASIRG